MGLLNTRLVVARLLTVRWLLMLVLVTPTLALVLSSLGAVPSSNLAAADMMVVVVGLFGLYVTANQTSQAQAGQMI